LKKSSKKGMGVRQALKKARRFAHTGHHFPFVFYSSHDTVFWPGCGLAGLYPAVVGRIVDILGGHLGADVGLTLDCCYDPVYQLGDIEAVGAALKSIEERLKRRSISRVITGCINCQKVLSEFLKSVTVEHILEALPRDAFTAIPEKHIYLHHPCPTFRSDSSIREQARELLGAGMGTITESREPMCCGYGGGLSSLSPDLAGQFTKRIIEDAGEEPIVTYCTGCQDRFARYGKGSTHMLELLRDSEPLRKPVSPFRRWGNRLLLSLSQKT
jgi:Fe-S oxidoreductase